VFELGRRVTGSERIGLRAVPEHSGNKCYFRRHSGCDLISVLKNSVRDLRHSARSLWRSPAVTLALLFTIALGIGTNAVIHGLTRGLVRGRSPIVDAERVVSIFGRAGAAGAFDQISREEYQWFRARVNTFEWVGAAQVSQRAVMLGERSVVLTVAAVTPEVGRLFGLPFGRGVVFGHVAAVSVKHVRIGDAEFPVDGVAPPALAGLYADRPVDLWMTLREASPGKLWVVARLRPGVTAEESGHACCEVMPYTGMTRRTAAGIERVSAVLEFGAGLVLLIACANVACFQLGRAAHQSKETSIRVALGAGRTRLASAVLSDSLVLALSGGALGVLLADWTSRIVPALLFPEDAASLVLFPNATAILLWSATTLGIIIVCGLAPVMETPHAHPADVLRTESSGASGRSRAVRALLVSVQMACCCVLVISTGYLHQGLRTALRTGASQRFGEIILATVHAHPDAGLRYFSDIERAASNLPGVSVRGWTTRLPGNQPAWRSYRIEPRTMQMRELVLDVAAFNSESLDRLRLPPVTGRSFGLADQACRTAIVNEEAAVKLFAAHTVGRIAYDGLGRPVVLIGIVASRDASRPARPTIYYDATRGGGSVPATKSSARFRTHVAAELETVELNTNVVSPEYFDAAGFVLLAGRLFPDKAQNGYCRVGVVNRQAAELYFRGDATGTAVIDEAGRRTEIIGVVQPARLGTLERVDEPAIYLPMEQDHQPRMTVFLAVPSATDGMLVNVRRTLEPVPGRWPLAPMVVRSLETHLSQTGLAQLRVATVILGASAVTGLLLSGLGLYAMLSDTARRQRREIAIRIALGARPRDVVGWVLSHGAKLAAAGTIAGMVASVVIARLLSRVAMTDELPAAWVWMAGPVMLASVVAVTSMLPARRSLMIDPVRALRDE
jgi:hypothetical protein